jgi:hypothetical protein
MFLEWKPGYGNYMSKKALNQGITLRQPMGRLRTHHRRILDTGLHLLSACEVKRARGEDFDI